MTEQRHVLDLFCGLGGFSQAFAESDRWSVTTVDIEARFDPDITADVFELRPSDFDREFDLVLASPPCTQFSLAASRYERVVDGEPQTDDARDAVGLVYHTIGLIKGLAPEYWVLENPQGYLRQVLGAPTGRVTYCQYGTDWMKPTDLWGEHPPMQYQACAYGDDCHADNTDQDHGGLGNCNVSGTRDPAERAKVPDELSAAIRDAVDAALDAPQPEQIELPMATDGGPER
jgi:hypothetical protein